MFSGRSPRTPTSWPSNGGMMSASAIPRPLGSHKPPSGPRGSKARPAQLGEDGLQELPGMWLRAGQLSAVM